MFIYCYIDNEKLKIQKNKKKSEKLKKRKFKKNMNRK